MNNALMSDENVQAEPVNTEIPLPGVPGELRLPSGGWAVLRPASSLNGAHVRRIRTGLNQDGDGDVAVATIALTLSCLVVDWQIPGLPQLPLPSGANPQHSLDRLPIDDFLALEEAVKPTLRKALGQKEKAEQGAPDPS